MPVVFYLFVLCALLLPVRGWSQVNAAVCQNDPNQDDSAAILSALTQPITQTPGTAKIALVPANRTCYVNLTGINALPSGARLMGIPGRSILKPFSKGQPILAVAGSNVNGTVDNISIEGVTFDGAGANLAPAGSALVSVQYARNFRFVNNVIQSSGGDVQAGEALKITNSAALIEGNDLSSFATQIDIYLDASSNLPAGGGISVTNNRIHNGAPSGGNGIYIHGPGSSTVSPVVLPVTVEGNNIVNSKMSSGDSGQSGNAVMVYQASFVRISQNHAGGPQSSCFRSSSSRDLIFTGNQCEGSGGIGLVSEFGSQHNQWLSNSVQNVSSDCIHLSRGDSAPPGQYHSVIGNHLSNCGGSGIAVEGSSVVSGNIIDHALTGILVGAGNGADALIKDNLIIDENSKAGGATQIGIGIENTVTGGIIVEGNQFDLSVPAIVGTNNGAIAGGVPKGVTVRNQNVTRSALGSPDDGSSIFCPNCGSGDCSAAGSGAFARRASGKWTCQ